MKTSLVMAVCTIGSLFVAQVAPPVLDTGLGQLIGNLGIMGVLVWHMWYHTTKTYPTMLERFSKEVGEIRSTFTAEQTALRTAFLTEQAAARDYSSRETAELRGMLFQNMQAMRTAVHDVKDTAQNAISQAGARGAAAAPPVRWEIRRDAPKPEGEAT